VVVNDGLEPKDKLFDRDEWRSQAILERGQILIGEGGVFVLKMSRVLLLLVLIAGGGLEEIVERVEEFGLFGGFEIPEAVGDFVLPEGLDGLGLFGGFKFVPNVPVLFGADVLIESFGLDEFGHQQQ
jgi:hypothetical protein